MEWIRQFDLFLFDFDGLLVDTEQLHYQAYQKTLCHYGHRLEWTFPAYCNLAHTGSTKVKEALYAEFPDLPSDWDAIYRIKKECYQELLEQGKIALMPGVAPLLEALLQAKIRSCTVTHSPRTQTDRIRTQLPILNSIPHWITREDYQKPKPDPECYRKAIELYGRPNDRVVGFEDTPRGLAALGGTRAVAVWISEASILQKMVDPSVRRYPSFEHLLQLNAI